MASTSAPAALPYTEPEIINILLNSSFLLLLNVINYMLDKAIYCGLLGQVLVGIAWGTPGAKWLTEGAESLIVELGYLGLILIVYEGGLSVSFSSLKANLFLSVAVAATGIVLPIALSFSLLPLSDATPLQAFAAGAALCSTSLGTTFTVLSSSRLTATRLGTVLASAAMMDDLVGLVMIQVTSNLGSSSSSFHAASIVRPLGASIGLVLVLVLVCGLIVRPLTSWICASREFGREHWVVKMLGYKHSMFAVHSAILIGLVTAASFAGASNLFAAYLAGASTAWWYSEGWQPLNRKRTVSGTGDASPTSETKQRVKSVKTNRSQEDTVRGSACNDYLKHSDGLFVYKRYYENPTSTILKPFFFASIGFSIPVSRMFTRAIVWRGIIYAILMAFGKLLTGLWLVRFSWSFLKSMKNQLGAVQALFGPKNTGEKPQEPASIHGDSHAVDGVVGQPAPGRVQLSHEANVANAITQFSDSWPGSPDTSAEPISHHILPAKPLSLYPASILGSAMIARGEIGFLMASVAASNGVFSSPAPESSPPADKGFHRTTSDIYFVVMWAIVLCTIVGPTSVGVLVRRVKKLQVKERTANYRADPLGVWGVL